MSSVEPEPPGAEAAHEPATVVTFYSYKGGVGRTMALANVAWILATEGSRVLVVDWDLESPGLHRFYHPFLNDPELTRTTGVVDMVQGYGRGVEALLRQELDEDEFELGLGELLSEHTDVLAHRDTVRWSDFRTPGSVDYLGPGVQNKQYSERVAYFDWAAFYAQHRGKRFVETLRERLRRGPYDYVLIDSRTGHSDNASVCTLWLPDVVVAGFNLSNQSIEGTASVAHQIHQQAREAGREIRILPVPMRVEHAEPGKAGRRRAYVEQRFAGLVAPLTTGSLEEYWGQVEVPHHPAFAYEETLVPFTLRPGTKSLQLDAYVRIAQEISRGKVSCVRPVPEPLRLGFAERFEEVRTPGRRTARIVYATPDRLWAEWIRGVLARVGISCETTAEWDPRTAGADTKPTYTILVVSPALQSAPALDAVIQQHIRAAGRLGSGDRTDSIVAVRVEETRVRPPLGDLKGPHLQSLGENEAEELLLEHFAHNGQARTPSSGGVRFPGTKPKIWQAPPRSATFQGREKSIGDLRDAFPPGRSVAPAILTGPLGVGKSRIALEFAYRFAADYDAIWWLRADTADSVREELAALGERLGIASKSATDAVARTLAALADGWGEHQRFLLVYDDARRPADLGGLLPGGGSSHVLITSDADGWHTQGRPFPVEMPTEGEAAEQLRLHFPGLPAALARDILDVSGRLPQTVEQAAAYIKNAELPLREAITAYAEAMRARAEDGPVQAGTEPGYPAAAHATWAVSMESLRADHPAAERVLLLLAHLAPTGAALDVLRAPAALGWLRPGGERATPASAGRAFHALGEHALARVDHGVGRVVGDPMGLRFLRESLTADEFRTSREAAQRILASLVPPGPEADEERHRLVFEELDQHVATSGAALSEDPDVRRWLVVQVRHRRTVRRLEPARALAEQLLNTWTQRYGSLETTEDVLTLRLAVELGNVHRDAGRFAAAEEINHRALNRLRATLGLEHPYTLRSATGRGAELRALGEVQDAFAEDQSTADILTSVSGADNPYTLMAFLNLGLSLAMVGMTAEALDLHRETYERCRRVLGIEHELTLSLGIQLGCRYRESGNYTTSLAQLRQALTEAEEHHGESDPVTLYASRALAATLRRAGRGDPAHLSTARKCDADAMAGWLAYAGPEHHERLAAGLALAADLRLLGEHTEACRLAEDCVRRYATWSEGHPFHRIAQTNLALCRRSAGLLDGTAELSEQGWQGLADSLGSDHPLTLIAGLDHANALVYVGESAAALELDRRTYDRLRVRCGDRHPLTSFAAANLQDSQARAGETAAGLPGTARTELDLDVPYI
ncbi:tetratricopeptide repeat protein [Streptomyces roseirectus]|uniref:Tetratricopeptide repeat protein n=1 Tax=Streptomyces roseirectus TaxID=2768066 RepID=A0A7H0IKT5_9ACTN|nr:FxSxx-COOH system tetratricopeptide repeat protein [Streptomyces roseirectus]QNP73401.1 tetratricopeptide repeat protein [Streptomyces roseirectus]